MALSNQVLVNFLLAQSKRKGSEENFWLELYLFCSKLPPPRTGSIISVCYSSLLTVDGWIPQSSDLIS